MKTNDFENDPLWDLLGNVPPVEVSPYFAQNVIREIRVAHENALQANPAANVRAKARAASVFQYWEIWQRCWHTAAITAAVLAIACMFGNIMIPNRDTRAYLSQNPDDVEVIKHLDELLTYEYTTVWLDQSAY